MWLAISYALASDQMILSESRGQILQSCWILQERRYGSLCCRRNCGYRTVNKRNVKFGFDDLCEEIVQWRVLHWCCDVSHSRFGRQRSRSWIGSVIVLYVCILDSLKCRSMCSSWGREGSVCFWVPSFLVSEHGCVVWELGGNNRWSKRMSVRSHVFF
jgi:hypothetical protein